MLDQPPEVNVVRAAEALEHRVSPWLRLVMPVLTALIAFIMYGLKEDFGRMVDKLDTLTDSYHELNLKVNTLEIKQGDIDILGKRVDQHDDRFTNFSSRIRKTEQEILFHQRDRHAPQLNSSP